MRVDFHVELRPRVNTLPAFLFSREVRHMPRKPKRPCSHPGCPLLTESRFCVAHQKQEDKRYEKYQRDPASRKRYNSAWRRIRAAYIAVHPLCERCRRAGRLTPAQEVHHIVPLVSGGTNAVENLMSLCKSCHSSIGAREGKRWG